MEKMKLLKNQKNINNEIPKKGIQSVLKIVKNKLEYDKEIYTKNYKKLQKECSDKTLDLVKENINKPLISKRLFVNHCLISNTKEKEIINKIKTLSNNDLYSFVKQKEIGLLNLDSHSDYKDTTKMTLFPYCGGKQKHKKLTQNLVSDILSKNKNIDTYIEPFVGGFGSVYNSLPLLLENGIKNIKLSDINQTIINTFRQVKNNYKSVQYQLSQIMIDYYKEYGTFECVGPDNFKQFYNKKRKDFYLLESKGICNSKRTALFLFLMNNTMGGICKYNSDMKRTNISSAFDKNRSMFSSIKLSINKVQIYHKILNLVNMTFRTRKYQSILKNNDNENTLIILDPPYMESKHMYGNNGFNHKELLDYIEKSNYHFIYFNNHNNVLEKFSKENNFKYLTKTGIYTNSKENQVSNECVMYSRIKLRRVQSSNIRLIRNRFISGKSINNNNTQYRKVS